MKAKITILFLISTICLPLFAQLPLVYNKENTGEAYPPPPLPAIGQLPVVDPLPDPFMWSDGSARSTSFGDWARRRNEIKNEIEHYETGTKPQRPETITATYETGGTLPAGVNDRLIVNVTVNGQTLTLTSNVSLPSGSGPFPAVIGMNSLNGSVPADIFTTRNIARITFSHNNVTTYGNPRNTDPYYRLYPDQNIDNAGQYSAWAWGVSRLIDGLELVQSSLPIDLSHLAVTGCSYAGKMALFAGALDERIALTIAQESGGGGAPAWRVSEFGGDVEKLGATDHNWFKESMFQFSGLNVPRLPHDHHELMAMVAPRALLVTGNTDFFWLSNPSCYVSARAAHEVYKTFGIGDRFGFYIDGGHGHCAIPAAQRPAIEAFVDKFLLSNTSANTNVTVHPYPDVDYERWYAWWGTGNPVFPDEGSAVKIWLETECGTVGSNWQVLTDSTASKRSYITIKSGLNSTASAPPNTPENQVIIPFTIAVAGTYNFLGRAIGPTATDDSYWVRIDDRPFVSANGLTSSQWQWGRLTIADLTAGQHTLTITYREDGAKLDKVLITTSNASVITPEVVGPNCCQAPAIAPAQVFSISENAANGASLGNVSATDADEGNVLQQWKITGGTGAEAFAIDASTGELTVKDSAALDFDAATPSYDLILQVSDGYFESAPDTVIINLTNINDNAPVVAPEQSFSISESAAGRTVAGTVVATDADDTNQAGFTQLRQWKITGGTGAWFFDIHERTGEIKARTTRWFDFERTTSYSLKVSVSDGATRSATTVVTIHITNENDNEPEVKRSQRLYIDTWVANGDVAGTALATDRDDRNQPGFTTFQHWQITGGSGERFFDIDAATGALIVTGSAWLNRDGGETYSLSLRVSDGRFRSEREQITIYVSKKVEICHKGRTIQLNRSAVSSHLRHGDSANACGDNNTMNTTPLAAAALDQGPRVNQYEIFPNPVTASARQIVVTLGSNNLHVKKIVLVDFYTSRVAKEFPIGDESTITIPCADLSCGIYVLRLLGDRPVTKVLVVE